MGLDETGTSGEIVVTRARGRGAAAEGADPITAEVVRHALNSCANQMKRTCARAAYSPVIFEVLDFAVALYDRELRLLAQAPTMPHFMGTLSFCVEGAVAGIGGEAALNPGDVVIYNWPYGVGAHPQDMAVVVPVFAPEGGLIGYAASKAHLLDIGGKDPYSTDTTDVHQEGTIYPGVKLYREGVVNEDVLRILLANSRVPKPVRGDLEALVAACRVGARGLTELVARFGAAPFAAAVEAIFDHGERIVRGYFERIPDGRYVARGQLDNDGIIDRPIPFEVAVEVSGSDVRLDFSGAPGPQAGPFNTPLPSTVSIARVAVTMLAGHSEAPNEGNFRPIEIITRRDSLFHAVPPTPCFLYAWPGLQAIEVIYRAIADALPEAVPASSGGCICSVVYWGRRRNGEPWADGAPHPVGQGAWAGGDGATAMYISQSATRLSPLEVWESRNPWIAEALALAEDSGGAGEFRGGLGLDLRFRLLEDVYITPVLERTKNPPWGLMGGTAGRPNDLIVTFPDGTTRSVPKATRFLVPEGATLEIRTGGGGGYGDPARRDPAAVRRDIAAGYVSLDYARRHHPDQIDPLA